MHAQDDYDHLRDSADAVPITPTDATTVIGTCVHGREVAVTAPYGAVIHVSQIEFPCGCVIRAEVPG